VRTSATIPFHGDRPEPIGEQRNGPIGMRAARKAARRSRDRFRGGSPWPARCFAASPGFPSRRKYYPRESALGRVAVAGQARPSQSISSPPRRARGLHASHSFGDRPPERKSFDDDFSIGETWSCRRGPPGGPRDWAPDEMSVEPSGSRQTIRAGSIRHDHVAAVTGYPSRLSRMVIADGCADDGLL